MIIFQQFMSLLKKKEIATNKKISEILGVKAASVSEMLKKTGRRGRSIY